MKLTKEILIDYIKRGLVEEARHKHLPLSIYNYTRECQYTGAWDEVTLMCRGLIVDDHEKIIGRGFDKFFNYEEVSDTVPWSSSQYVYVQEKMDGSLGILFYYADDWHLATKGSFHSEQSVRGMEIIREKFFLPSFQREYTYIVEIIYPENRIVVSYPKPTITFLSVFLNRSFAGWKDGGDDELHWTTAQAILSVCGGVKKKDLVSTEQVFDELSHSFYKKLKEANLQNKEGYILRFFPSNFRCKIKFDDYVRLHRLLTNFSNVDIWEALRTNKNITNLLDNVPDEFDEWVRGTKSELEKQYQEIEREYEWIFNHILRVAGANERKEFARIASSYKYPGILFNMLDEKDYSQIIWKEIRPVYQKPFWSKSDQLDEE
jgi:tRNA splicing ligase